MSTPGEEMASSRKSTDIRKLNTEFLGKSFCEPLRCGMPRWSRWVGALHPPLGPQPEAYNGTFKALRRHDGLLDAGRSATAARVRDSITTLPAKAVRNPNGPRAPQAYAERYSAPAMQPESLRTSERDRRASIPVAPFARGALERVEGFVYSSHWSGATRPCHGRLQSSRWLLANVQWICMAKRRQQQSAQGGTRTLDPGIMSRLLRSR